MRKGLAPIEAHRENIIQKLKANHAKVWFPTNASGETINLEDMTYHEAVISIIGLMYQPRCHAYKESCTIIL